MDTQPVVDTVCPFSLVPRPLPDFISQPWTKISLHASFLFPGPLWLAHSNVLGPQCGQAY